MKLIRLSNLFLDKKIGFSKLHTTKDITTELGMTAHYVSFETFIGSRHSIVRLSSPITYLFVWYFWPWISYM
jgi:hypothetical protein